MTRIISALLLAITITSLASCSPEDIPKTPQEAVTRINEINAVITAAGQSVNSAGTTAASTAQTIANTAEAVEASTERSITATKETLTTVGETVSEGAAQVKGGIETLGQTVIDITGIGAEQ